MIALYAAGVVNGRHAYRLANKGRPIFSINKPQERKGRKCYYTGIEFERRNDVYLNENVQNKE